MVLHRRLSLVLAAAVTPLPQEFLTYAICEFCAVCHVYTDMNFWPLLAEVLVRQDKPGGGGSDDVANDTAETSDRDPAGRQSRPAKAGPQPEASLARPWVTASVKRRQRVGGPCDRAPKAGMEAEADAVQTAEGNTEAP